MKRAVILLSGGLDSATTAALARNRGFDLFALTLAYGQRHAVELDSARRLAAWFGAAEHVVQQIDLRVFGGSALTANIAVPKNRGVDLQDGVGHDAARGPTAPAGAGGERSDGGGSDIPVTYVPARNTIFLAMALAYAEARAAGDIFIGVNALDYSGYPDCRPAFIAKFQELARLATREGVAGRPILIHAPLIHMTKAQIIRSAVRLGVDLGLTMSCYDPNPAGQACGSCDSCLLRRRGFQEAGVADPTQYAPRPLSR